MSSPYDDEQPPSEDHFLAFTGDQASAARLRANLVEIAADHAGTPLAAVIDEVLASRRHIRDLADNQDFSDLIAVGMDDYRTALASLTPEERAQMVANAKHSTTSAE